MLGNFSGQGRRAWPIELSFPCDGRKGSQEGGPDFGGPVLKILSRVALVKTWSVCQRATLQKRGVYRRSLSARVETQASSRERDIAGGRQRKCGEIPAISQTAVMRWGIIILHVEPDLPRF